MPTFLGLLPEGLSVGEKTDSEGEFASVVVSAFNSGEQSTPATRPEPALTVDQLTALATSPQWLKLQQR